MAVKDWMKAQVASQEQYDKHMKKYGFRHYLFQFALVNSTYNTMPDLIVYYITLSCTYALLLYHLFCYVSTMFAAYKIERYDMVVTNVHSVVLAIFILSVTTSYVVDKRQILLIEDKYLEKLYKYEDEVECPKAIFEHIMDHAGLHGIISGGAFLFFIVYVFAPLIDLRFWEEDCLKENINFCIALPMWHPYESDIGWKYYVTILVQTIFGVYRISVFCSVQITLVLWPAHMARELSNLKLSLEKLEDRVKARYFRITQTKLTNANYSHMYKDKYFNECAKFCLHENIKHHQNIIT